MNGKFKFVILGGVLFVTGVFFVSAVEGAGLLPSLYDLQHNVRQVIRGPAPQTLLSVSSGCDQSATSTDCVNVQANPKPAVPQTQDISSVATYSEVATTKQDGRVDAHLTVDNTLRKAQFCNKSYKSRQIIVDGVDVVQRIAGLVTAGATPKDSTGNSIATGICNSMPSNMIYTKGILETSDVSTYVSDDSRLPGDTYRVYIAAQGFDVNSATGKVYMVGGYAGTLTQIGTLQ